LLGNCHLNLAESFLGKLHDVAWISMFAEEWWRTSEDMMKPMGFGCWLLKRPALSSLPGSEKWWKVRPRNQKSGFFLHPHFFLGHFPPQRQMKSDRSAFRSFLTAADKRLMQNLGSKIMSIVTIKKDAEKKLDSQQFPAVIVRCYFLPVRSFWGLL
jgi:hypothetical protein